MRSLLGLARTGTIATMIAACTSSGTQPPADVPPLQMNDLSVLFPLATSPGDFATYLSPTSPGAGAALLPEALYASDPLADEIRTTGCASSRSGSIRVSATSARSNPVPRATTRSGWSFSRSSLLMPARTQARQSSPPTLRCTCCTRLRVSGSWSQYTMTTARAQLSDADFGLLAVHPLLVQDGLGGTFAKQLRSLIATYADSTKIERITSFSVIQNLMSNQRTNRSPLTISRAPCGRCTASTSRTTRRPRSRFRPSRATRSWCRSRRSRSHSTPLSPMTPAYLRTPTRRPVLRRPRSRPHSTLPYGSRTRA